MTIWYRTPYALDKNLGRAMNEEMALIPDDEDWVVFTDADTMWLTPDYGHQIKEIIERHPGTGIFTCYANRVGKNHGQRYKGVISPDPNIIHWRKEACKLQQTSRVKVKELREWITGVCLIIQKSSWEQHKFPEHTGILDVDKLYSHEVLQSGERILLMEGVLLFHYYRMLEGEKHTSHLL
jgi:GT2 family glycosyltransferase